MQKTLQPKKCHLDRSTGLLKYLSVSHNSFTILYHRVPHHGLAFRQVMYISVAGTEEEGVAVGPLGRLCLDVKDSQVRRQQTRRSLFAPQGFCDGPPLHYIRSVNFRRRSWECF